jgi:DNA (cytosine-5)-methyltransferase 1
MSTPKHGFYEFFAGGGMARLGLGDDWNCLFANEWSSKKAISYRANFPPASELRVEDIWRLSVADLPGKADLAWASFPCQDLSLAGNGAGLDGVRSGTLIKFWSLMVDLAREGRRVPIIALENVVGALTSNEGRDFHAMAELATEAGYRFGALVIDAARFVPQSRPRLFFIAVSDCVEIPAKCELGGPGDEWHNTRLRTAVGDLSARLQDRWIWWALPRPPHTPRSLNDIIEFENDHLTWHDREETERILAMMSEANATKIRKAKAYGKRIVGTIYKRVRIENGAKAQRAEVRFDQISGCLRTPVGGSSRQTIIVVEGRSVRSRLMTPREAVRLMGLPDSYRLPESYNDGYHLAGDGVVVSVVRFVATHILAPLLDGGVERGKEAA